MADVTAEQAEQVEREVRSRFPEGAIERVVLLRHGDDPAIEPGRLGVRVLIDPAGNDALEAFESRYGGAFKQLARDLPALLPEGTRFELSDGTKSLFLMPLDAPGDRPGDLTPVMARLGPADLETLDTLIGAGIAPNRAEAVRWALARIRDRPAYEELRRRGRELEELKAQF
jgi:hypothetical protein